MTFLAFRRFIVQPGINPNLTDSNPRANMDSINIRRMYQLSTRTRTLRPSSKRYTARIRVLAATSFPVLLIPGTRRVNKGKATGCFSRLITQARLTQHWPLTYCA
ncbi:hypothetical protein, partial [Thiolapillus sp.]|uniref:hypothetical protein n=1 Tax=Thiolapillus sp. TaxID=2017437 RepID=UPI003AF4D3B6